MTKEEAIEVYYGLINPKIKEAFEFFAPELCENEDERIRKKCIELIKRVIPSGDSHSQESKEILDCIAYLERQKDIWKERAKNITANMLEDRIEGIQRELIEFLSNAVDASWVDIIQSADAYAERIRNIIEKQKEQKSFNISAASEWLRKHVGNYMNSEYNEFHKCVEYDGSIDKERLVNDFKEAMQKEQKPILEVFGFKVGDTVRLKDGDGRKHIIKSFEEVEGIHGPNFYHVEFEDNSASDGIYPGEEYPNGYYTQMEKFEEKQKLTEWSEKDERMLEVISYKISQHQGNDERSLFTPDEAKFIDDMEQKLKYLCPQPHTVSIKDATKFGNLEYERGVKDGIQHAKNHQWKPSEEQLKALRYYLNNVPYSLHKEHLSSLRDDCEKLFIQ